jgi:nitrous oxidase accessory protein NosD
VAAGEQQYASATVPAECSLGASIDGKNWEVCMSPILYPRAVRRLALSVTVICGFGGIAASTASAHRHNGHHRHGVDQATLFVSPSAQANNSDDACATAAYSTIQSAVDAASAGSTVVVCTGTYHEQVVLKNPLNLQGEQATIDETGVKPGLVVNIPGLGSTAIDAAVVVGSSNVTIEGFTVQNALGEGILAAGVSSGLTDVDIEHNSVVNNDKGVPPASTYFECQPAGQIPGDCGEGIHYINVSNSEITGNYISGNSGGVLFTDETGPTHDNVIARNIITANLFDCGVTLPGHNPNALSATGARQPTVGGVYDNEITHNVITGNGVLGEGAGVLFANAGPGTASYDNTVEHNYISDNELAGVTMHAHTIGPGQFEDLNGNQIVENIIGKNNTGGDPLDSSPQNPGAPQDKQTTGVLVFSGGTPIQTTITDNQIFSDAIGVWLSAPVTADNVETNSFLGVTTPISANN